MSKQARNPGRARRVFLDINGEPPWRCFFCDEWVTQIGQSTWDGNIHHVDEDAMNDVPDNLVMCHTICHQQYHSPTDELKQRISAKLKGRRSPTKGMKFSPDVCAKHSRPGTLNPFFGKQHTEETKTKMRQPRRRVTCDDCGNDFALNWIKRHKREGKCVQ